MAVMTAQAPLPLTPAGAVEIGAVVALVVAGPRGQAREATYRARLPVSHRAPGGRSGGQLIGPSCPCLTVPLVAAPSAASAASA